MSDLIGYDYDVIEDKYQALVKINQGIEDALNELARQTGNALDNWTGEAAANYNLCASDIDTKFSEMNNTLADLARELQIRAADMKDQDHRSGRRF